MNKNIRVLSYNIFWKAYNNALKQCKNDNCKNNTDYNIKCEHDREPLDFIAVQEATNFKLGPGIKEHYYYIRVRQRKETMITYFSKKYDLIKYYYGNLAHNDDRPYMLLIFENMWFINIHMPHNIHIVDELVLLEEKIKSHELIHANERIIVAGDFNYNFFNDTNLYLFGIPIYYTQINKILERNYDAVLDTEGPPISLKVVENIKKYASDHLPVVAVLL